VQAKAYAEGFDLADINEVTVRSLYREWSGDETIYRIKKGYGALADYLHRQCIQNGVQILTAHIVDAVEWRKDSVRVACSNGQLFFADKLLMTIPVSQLTQDKIRYIPAIDIALAKAIGWGHVVKVLLSFNEIFWQPDISFIFSDQLIPTWWTMLPDTRPVWMGWVGGTAAKELSIQADDALLQHALASLGNILHMPADDLRARLKAHKVMNWQHMPYIGGGYTYAMPGTDDSRNTLKEGIDDTIFFAGEGIYTGGFSGTIEAAIISAKEACGRILGSL
jgi:monoamine oxidase